MAGPAGGVASGAAAVAATNTKALTAVRRDATAVAATAARSEQSLRQGLLGVAGVSNLAPMEQGIARMDRLSSQSKLAGANLGLVQAGALIAIAAVAALGVMASRAAEEYQSAMTTVVNNAHLSAAATVELSAAIAQIAIGTSSSSMDMVKALAPVAGELARVEGGALDAAKTVGVLTAAQNLHEAASVSLTSGLKALTDLIVTYGGDTTKAAEYSDLLFQAQAQLGIGADRVASAVQRLKPRLAGANLDLRDMLAIVREITPTIGTGQRAIMMFGATMQQLVSPSKAAVTAMMQQGVVLTDSKGKFIGVGAALDKLKAAYTGISDPIARNTFLTELFGRRTEIARVLIEGGSQAIRDNAAALAANGTAAEATARVGETIADKWETAKAALETAAVTVGTALIPAMTAIATVAVNVTTAIANLASVNPEFTAMAGVALVALGALKLLSMIGVLGLVKNLALSVVAKLADAAAAASLSAANAGLLASEAAVTAGATAETAALGGVAAAEAAAAAGAATLTGAAGVAAGLETAAAAAVPAATVAGGVIGGAMGVGMAAALALAVPAAIAGFLILARDEWKKQTASGGFATPDLFGGQGALAPGAGMTPGTWNQDQAAAVASTQMQDLQSQADETAAAVEQAAANLAAALTDGMDAVTAAAESAGGKAMLEMAKGITDAQNAPMDALRQLHTMLATDSGFDEMAEIARIQGELVSKDLAEGLADGNEGVRAAALGLQKTLTERYDQLTGGAYSAGQTAMKALGAGMASGDISAIASAAVAFGKAQSTLSQFTPTSAEAATGIATVTKALADMDAKGTASATDFVAKYKVSMAGVVKASRELGAASMTAYAQGIASTQNAPLEALKTLHAAMAGAMSNQRRVAFLLAALAGTDIAEGLKSSDPYVRAQAEATVKIITDQLDALTNGAYSAGQAAAENYAKGFAGTGAKKAGTLSLGISAKAATVDLGLSAKDLAQGRADWAAYLKSLTTGAASAGSSLSTLASDFTAKMSDAFASVKTRANTFFDLVHSRHLRAITDAHDLAIATAQKQFQAPVTASQAAVAAERAARQQAGLEAAVAGASNPADKARAQQDLADFLADQQITRMQATADAEVAAATTAADAKQKVDTETETKRYQKQKTGFATELTELQKYLKRHPEEWKSAQDKVLALLATYEVPYNKAGSGLSQAFIDGLVSQTKAIEKAAEGLAGAAASKLSGKPKPKGDTWVPPVGKAGAEGIMDVQAAAMHLLHPGEMVVRAREAAMVRRAMGAGTQSSTGAMMASWGHMSGLWGEPGGVPQVGPGGPFPGTQFKAPDGQMWTSKLDYTKARQAGIATLPSYASGVWDARPGKGETPNVAGASSGAMMASFIGTTKGIPVPKAWVEQYAPQGLSGDYGRTQERVIGWLKGPGGPFPGTQRMSAEGWWWNSKLDWMKAREAGIASHATGSWQTADEMARIHADEMVIPAREATQLRSALGPHEDFGALAALASRQADGRRPSGLVSASPGVSGGAAPSGMYAPPEGGGTIVVRVGEEELARVSDKRLFIDRRLRMNR